MKLFKNFSLGLIGLMITAMLLVACGDSPTPVPAATTAAATATTAPKPTTAAATAAPTTAAPTTAAATTSAPTTAAATATTAPKPTTAVATTAPATTAASPAAGSLPVPSGTRALKLTPTLTSGLVGLFGKGSGTTEVKFEAYATSQVPADLSSFYDEKLVELGYASHPETHSGQQQGNASFLSASFTKDGEVLSVALLGPIDQSILAEFASLETTTTVSPDQDLTKQLKVGDTMIMAFTIKDSSFPTVAATVPATTVAPTTVAATTAAATTAAATGPAIKVPTTATELNLSPSLAKAIEGEFGAGAKNGSMKTYTTKDGIDTLAAFFEKSLPTQGYTLIPDSQQHDTQNGVDIASAGFTNGKDVVVIVMFGPMDESTINLLSGLDPEPLMLATELSNQVNVGDTMIFVVKGTK